MDSLLGDDSENKSICAERVTDILKVLNTLVMHRREFSIEFHPKITELFSNESGLKTESLSLAAKIIEVSYFLFIIIKKIDIIAQQIISRISNFLSP